MIKNKGVFVCDSSHIINLNNEHIFYQLPCSSFHKNVTVLFHTFVTYHLTENRHQISRMAERIINGYQVQEIFLFKERCYERTPPVYFSIDYTVCCVFEFARIDAVNTIIHYIAISVYLDLFNHFHVYTPEYLSQKNTWLNSHTGTYSLLCLKKAAIHYG